MGRKSPHRNSFIGRRRLNVAIHDNDLVFDDMRKEDNPLNSLALLYARYPSFIQLHTYLEYGTSPVSTSLLRCLK
jgi:hypothetical protein